MRHCTGKSNRRDRKGRRRYFDRRGRWCEGERQGTMRKRGVGCYAWWLMSGGGTLQQKGSDLTKVVWDLGGKLLAPHLGAGRVTKCLGNSPISIDSHCLKILRGSACLVDVGPKDSPERELAYGNHMWKRRNPRQRGVAENAVGDTKTKRENAVPVRLVQKARGLWINPVGVTRGK